MNERILAIRKKLGLTQKEFGMHIGGLSQNYIWMIEKGDRVPSDRTISDICREFNVSEAWLRTGEGEMFQPSPAMRSFLSSPPKWRKEIPAASRHSCCLSCPG